MIFLFYFVIMIASVLSLIYRRKTKYWSDRGFPYDKPRLLTGSIKIFGNKRHFTDAYEEIYDKFKNKEPIVGFHLYMKPALMVLNPDLAKQILIKDFNSFSSRALYSNEEDDPLTAHLVSLEGSRWRKLRHKLTPTFTSGKMKFMYPTIIKVANRFESTFDEIIKVESIVDVAELFGRFTTDIIGNCAFGIECNSLKDPEATFLKMGKESLQNRHGILIRGLMMSFPDAARSLHMKFIKENASKFFMKIIKENVDFREKNNIRMNDFMDILIEMKNKPNPELTMNELAAQAYIFFVAGFETSSTTMGFALHELAVNQHIQDKVRTEINEVLEKHNSNFTYECMLELKYLDQVVDETLRRHSVIPSLIRKAMADYKIPQTELMIEKGTLVVFPIDSIHNDEDIYPNPNVFDPERFTPEAINSRKQCSYLPFGDGPRNCIGMRFGKMQVKVGLVSLLRKFKFSVCDKTAIPIQKFKGSLSTTTLNGIFLKCERV